MIYSFIKAGLALEQWNNHLYSRVPDAHKRCIFRTVVL